MSKAHEIAQRAHDCRLELAQAPDSLRRSAICAAADSILERQNEILAANARDMSRSREAGMSDSLLDRLMLNESRLEALTQSMREVAAQADPLGRVLYGHTLDNGIRMEQVSVALGVVAMIYEARPNVTADAFALCMRAGNPCILRGGSAAHDSCLALAEACRAAVVNLGLPADAVNYLDAQDHQETFELMQATGLVDVLIPRGGASLIKSCVENSKVPVIETGVGNCHIYLHEAADERITVPIVLNAKTSRPGVCNAAESLLVDASAAERLLPAVLRGLAEAGVQLLGDELAMRIAEAEGIAMEQASEDDWGCEYLDLKISVKCVSGLDEAIEHINRYGTGHSEAIISRDSMACEQFLSRVDAAAVYTNASTRFTDGGVFGLGAEIGISTQRLHARGPMGAEVLTSTKYILRGEGQVR